MGFLPPLTKRDVETLRDLDAAGRNLAQFYGEGCWAQPLDLGASNGSHHSQTLNKLARRGLAQFKQRGAKDPPPGENGRSGRAGRNAVRGAKVYRITDAGRVLTSQGKRS